MEGQAIEIIETEVVLEEAMSMNHSRLIGRLTVALSAYEERYEIFPELEFELAAGRLKPDVAILPRLAYDWEADVIRCPTPPITAIEVLSPTQAFDYLVGKIRQLYFPSGVQSAWLVVPAGRTVFLFLPG
ncbi:MAG: Uma2 family endonuclease, partial [Hymenobacter sp.]